MKISEYPLTKLGFIAPPWFGSVSNIYEVIKICQDEKIKSMLDEQDVEFDGLVIKIANEEYRQLIGSTTHHPKWAIAYKFAAKQARTKLLNIERQIGRTGILTPVANVQTVELSGIKISRVTLHNWDFIINKNIYISDQVLIQRSGEVIPYIVSILPEYRDGSEKIPSKPLTCPSCGDKLSEETSITGNTTFYCENISCPATIKERIKHFVSRDCMNIEGLGDAIIDMMVENNILKSVDDLYKLSDPNIRLIVKSLPGMGDKKIDNVISQIEKSKDSELRRIINALGIKGVGKKQPKL